jgi:hypothetical protein
MQSFKKMDTSEFTKLVKDIASQRVALEAGINIAAAQAVAFSIVDRNSTPAQLLYEALRTMKDINGKVVRNSGIRANALVKYFEKFGNLAYVSKDKASGERDKVTFFEATIDGRHELVQKEILPPGKLEWTEKFAAYLGEQHWADAKPTSDPVSAYDTATLADQFFSNLRRKQRDAGITLKHEDLLERMYATYAAWVSEDAVKRAKALSEAEQGKIVQATKELAHMQ